MNRWVSAAVVLGVLAMWGTRVAADDQAAFAADGKALAAAIQKKDCKASLPLARRITSNPVLSKQTSEFQLATWSIAALCAVEQGRTEEAFEASRIATKLPGAIDSLWTYRIETGVDLKRPDDVAEAVSALAHVKPTLLSTVPVQTFTDLEQDEPQGQNSAAFMRVAAALETADYHPPSPTENADFLWLDYAQALADSGDAAHAAALLDRITDASALMKAKLDGRFAAAVSANPERFDLKADAERQLMHDRAIASAHPDLLMAVVITTIDLRALGRYEEALTIVELALDRAQHVEQGKAAFSDQADVLNWVLDQKASLLAELGRNDESLAVERAAARLDESGGANVSQVINLAGELNEAGRPQEALKTVARFAGDDTKTSAYGAGWVHEVRACADQALGRTAELAREMSYLAAHVTDNPAARLRALLCANDLDGLAAELIVRLQDPQRREQMLVDLSQFNPSPHPMPVGVATWTARMDAIRVRADVREAVAKVGHTEVIPLNGDPFTDLF